MTVDENRTRGLNVRINDNTVSIKILYFVYVLNAQIKNNYTGFAFSLEQSCIFRCHFVVHGFPVYSPQTFAGDKITQMVKVMNGWRIRPVSWQYLDFFDLWDVMIPIHRHAGSHCITELRHCSLHVSYNFRLGVITVCKLRLNVRCRSTTALRCVMVSFSFSFVLYVVVFSRYLVVVTVTIEVGIRLAVTHCRRPNQYIVKVD